MIGDEFNFTWGLAQELLNQLGYVQVTGFMLDSYTELGLTRNEFLCVIHLARFHYNSPQGESRPSAISVAMKMGYSHPNSVRQLVRSLEIKKMLRVTRIPGKPSIYDASPFAKAAFELWQQSNIPMLGSDADTLTSQCDTPSHPNVTEEKEEKKKGVQEKKVSADADLPDLSEDGPKAYVPGPGKLVSCVDPDTDEEVGEPDWRLPSTQVQHQAFAATGRQYFGSKTQRRKLERIEAMLEGGEFSQEFWENRLWNAEHRPWSLDKPIKYTTIDKQSDWRARQ